ncbi:cadmium resistance transporter [Clostridium sp.]|uniref:cadmium resistance transporter n=1 Tax=Clostridium sp. TaxID=1506 RepID=UPI003216459B
MGHEELQNDENIERMELEEITYIQKKRTSNFAKYFINPSVIKVFSLTFANGADNIGIYVPLFTSMSLVSIVVIVIIFMILIALWCFIGLKLAEHSFVQRNIKKYKHIFVPIVFICLGVFILMESRTISFIFKKVI